LRHDKKGKFSKIVNRVAAAKIPIKATLVFPISSMPQNKQFCDVSNDRNWREAAVASTRAFFTTIGRRVW